MGYIDKAYSEPIPKGMQILIRIEAEGVFARLDNARAFINGYNNSIELIPEPANKHDKNAIMVIGNVTVKQFFFFEKDLKVLLGYVPADMCEELLQEDLHKKLKVRMVYVGAGDKGGKVEIHLLGEKAFVKQYKAQSKESIKVKSNTHTI